MRTTPTAFLFLGLCLAAPACGGGGGEGTAPSAGGGGTPGPEQAPAGLRFQARREIALPGRPTGLVAHDLVGDAHVDLVLATRSPATLTVIVGAEGGPRSSVQSLPLGDDAPLGPVRVGDSVAVALQGDRRLLVFDGSDGLGAPRLEVALPGVPRALGTGDVDGDGSPEILLATADDALLVVDATGALHDFPLPPSLVGRPTFVQGTKDGRALLVGSQIGEEVLVYRCADLVPGTQPAPALVLPFDGIPRAVLEANLDGDADRELVVVGGDDTIQVHGFGRLPGTEAWMERPEPLVLRSPGVVPVDVEARDFDGDGRDELVIVNFYDSGYALVGGLAPEVPGSTRGSAQVVVVEYAGQDPVDAALADLDGDGHPDLALANRNAHRLGLLIGRGELRSGQDAFHQARRIGVGRNPSRLAALDLDADGFPEVLTLDAGDEHLTLLPNDGGRLRGNGPRFEVAPDARELASGTWAARDTRVLVAREHPDQADLLPLTWDGEALRPGAPWPLPQPAVAVLPGSGGAPRFVGRDGRAFEGTGSAPPGAWSEVPPQDVPGSRLTADFDGDGLADVARLQRPATDTAPGTIEVTLGSGLPLAPLPTGAAPSRIAAGDVDGDGRDELLCAAQNSHNVNLWTFGRAADGSPTVARLPDLGVGLGPLDVLLVDLDASGGLDVVTANNFSGDVSIVRSP